MNSFQGRIGRELFFCCSILMLLLAGASAPAQEGPAEAGPLETAAEALPKPLPPDWRSFFLKEPVLGSTIRIVRAGNRHNPPLVLVHGLGQNGLMDWEAIIEALKDRYYIIAPDLPGFGQSTVPAGRLSPANLSAVLHWLLSQNGLLEPGAGQPIHMVGHSMGGAVALYYAATYPRQLGQLTLIDAAGILHRAAFVKSVADVDRRNYEFLPEFLQRPAARLLNFGNRMVESINLWPDFTRPLQKNDLAWAYLLGDQPNTNAALALINTDFSRVIDQVKTPTRIIWGARDPVAPLRTAYLLNGLIDPSDLQIIPDAEHVPIKSHSEKVATLLQKPLAERPPLQAQRPVTAAANRPAVSPGEELPVLTCRGRTGQQYSGHFSRVVLNNCVDIRLIDVVADSIELRGSAAELINVRVSGGETALRLLRSSAVVTNAQLNAAVAVHLNASRLDMAGVRLQASRVGLDIDSRSVVIASISEVVSPLYQGKLHGAVRAENARGEALDELRSRSLAAD